MAEIKPTNYAQDINTCDIGEEFDAMETRLDKSNANTEAVLEANESVAEANAAANQQAAVDNAEDAKIVGGVMQVAGTILSVIPGCGVAGAVLSGAGAAEIQACNFAAAEATGDTNGMVASTGNLATTVDESVKEAKKQSATGETTLEGEAGLEGELV